MYPKTPYNAAKLKFRFYKSFVELKTEMRWQARVES